MKHHSIFIALILPLFLGACGDNNAPGTSGSDSSAQRAGDVSAATPNSTGTESAEGQGAPVADAPTGEAKRPYDVKSGIIAMRNSMASGTQTIYFDDYGRRQAIHADMEMMGKKLRNVQIIDGDWAYSYDADAKVGQKMKAPAGGGSLIPDPAELTEEKKKELNYRPLESLQIAGITAEGASMEMPPEGGMPASSLKAWTWKRVPLKMELAMQGMPSVVTEAISAEFDVDIPAERFRVPGDVKISEQATPQGNR